ncbi:MAG: thiamine pyrophosphate-dependent enzyme [Candidatus Micrarchaeota archaeon]
MASLNNFNEPTHTNNWCPGCPNFGVLAALKKALVELDFQQKDVVVVSGVGCSSKLPHYIKTYGFESLHGRSLPPAFAIKLANHDLNVIAVGGDGDGYGIGLNHLIHALRRNPNITYIVTNNQVYGLTTGQTSPTSLKGMKTKSTPEGVIENPVNPMAIALGAGGSFIARGFAIDVPHLTDLIIQGIKHKGFSFIDCLQPCLSFNKINTIKYFQERVYKLSEDYDSSDYHKAMEKAWEWNNNDKIPLGVLYKKEAPTYEEQISSLKEKPLVKQDATQVDISALIKEYV